MLTLYTMRHGETVLSNTLRGILDDDLTSQGWQQMQSSWENFAHQSEIQAIVSSDLKRCRLFAQQKAMELAVPIDVFSELQELNFGEWEGQKVADLYQNYPEQLAQFWQTPCQFTAPQAESLNHFAQRIDRALVKIQQFAVQCGVTQLLVVTHGGVIKYLTCKAQSLDLNQILTVPADLGTIYPFYYHHHNLTRANV